MSETQVRQSLNGEAGNAPETEPVGLTADERFAIAVFANMQVGTVPWQARPGQDQDAVILQNELRFRRGKLALKQRFRLE